MSVFILLIITTAIGLLSNVIANWIAPTLEQRRFLTVVIFITLSVLSVIIVNNEGEKKDDKLEEKEANPKESEEKEIKPKEPEKPIRDTITIIQKYSQEKKSQI